MARYGGEEFAIILPGVGADHVFSIGERVHQAICSEPVRMRDGSVVTVTISVGLTVFAGPDDTPEGMIRRADESLYTAKRTGRNRTVIAEPEATSRPVDSLR